MTRAGVEQHGTSRHDGVWQYVCHIDLGSGEMCYMVKLLWTALDVHTDLFNRFESARDLVSAGTPAQLFGRLVYV